MIGTNLQKGSKNRLAVGSAVVFLLVVFTVLLILLHRYFEVGSFRLFFSPFGDVFFAKAIFLLLQRIQFFFILSTGMKNSEIFVQLKSS